MKPLILISNDDGIKAKGLKELCRAAEGLGEVVIAAPDREKSGAAGSITIWRNLKAVKKGFPGAAAAYSVNGTPVDCVKLAALKLLERRPDIVLSGINHGPNYGKFILYSGTVGAAVEAALLGIPSMAFSLSSFSPDADFTAAKEYAAKLIRLVLEGKIRMNSRTMLNINI
ncbi:MAG TPA: 5'/3'-nucleotidase SurE, partial [bacterium]|nr:5'/3'-nucleotidase SurE [bacterium]